MADVLHRRNAGSFRFGINALCGASGQKLQMTTNTRWVKCPECLWLIAAMRKAAKERMAAL